MVSIITQFLHVRTGLINNVLRLVGLPVQDFMGNPDAFRSIYVWSGVWQGAGFSAMIYTAAIAGIDPTLYEAAAIDGSTRFKNIYMITLPCILPTICIILIMNTGGILNSNFDQMWLLRNSANLSTAEVIDTYVYQRAIYDLKYSFGTAVGLFKNVINFILLMLANGVTRALGQETVL